VEDLKIIICNESTSQSIISDIFTFGSLVFVLFSNYMWLGNNDIIIYMIFILFILKCVGSANSKVKRMTGPEAYSYLQQRFGK